MASKIDSKSQRSKLAPRREPYWSRIEDGFFLGYRKFAQGTGTWIARIRADGKQKYHALGTFEDYDAAQKAAREWRGHLDQGVEATDLTVGAICKTYVERQETRSGKSSASDARGRFKRLVYDKPIGKIILSKLKTSDIRAWINGQLANDPEDDDEDLRKSKDSANRNLAALKAALNLALKDRLVATDAGWKTITPFKGVGRRREHMLSSIERQALLAACDSHLANLVRGLLLTGARPGELAKAKVADFDQKAGTLILDGKTGRRIVTLSTPARMFFVESTKDKLPSAPLLSNSFGHPWGKDDWKKPFKEAAASAGLPPDVVMYTLRHTAISEMIMGGMSSGVVAMLAGTSTTMIDKHYGHLQHDQTRSLLDRVAIL